MRELLKRWLARALGADDDECELPPDDLARAL